MRKNSNVCRTILVLTTIGAGASLLGGGGNSLRAAEPAPRPAQLQAVPANTWVRLKNGNYGRNSTALVYLPSEKIVLMIGGTKGKEGKYSELTFNKKSGGWENRFPKGKLGAWGTLTGASKAPGFGYNESFLFKRSPFKDYKGNFRPNLAYGYNHYMEVWSCAALDRTRGKVVIPFHVGDVLYSL